MWKDIQTHTLGATATHDEPPVWFNMMRAVTQVTSNYFTQHLPQVDRRGTGSLNNQKEQLCEIIGKDSLRVETLVLPPLFQKVPPHVSRSSGGHHRRCLNTLSNHQFVIFCRSTILINIVIWWVEERERERNREAEKHCWCIQIKFKDQNPVVNKPAQSRCEKEKKKQSEREYGGDSDHLHSSFQGSEGRRKWRGE